MGRNLSIKLTIMVMGMVIAVATLGIVYGLWNETISVQAIIVNNGTFDPSWIDTFTNDDGTVDDPLLDPDDDNGVTVPELYDGWGGTSSTDPREAGPNAARYDKDVARCLTSSPRDTTGNGEKDSFDVMIENGYPSYTCTLWGIMQNQGLSPEQVRSVEIDLGVIYGNRDGVSTSGSPVFNTISLGGDRPAFDFQAKNIQPGFKLEILSGPGTLPGVYTILSVDGPHQVTLTQNLTDSATQLYYRVGPPTQAADAITVAELTPTVAGQMMAQLGDKLTAAFWVHVEQAAEQGKTYYFTIRMPIDVVVAPTTTGTIGFWKNWDKHKTYSQATIEGCLGVIDGTSSWFGPPTTVGGMVTFMNNASGRDRQARFLGQYLALRLNACTNRIPGFTFHDTSSVDPDNYLGLPGGPGSFTLSQIIARIETKYPPPTPSGAQFDIMKDVADGINNNVI